MPKSLVYNKKYVGIWDGRGWGPGGPVYNSIFLLPLTRRLCFCLCLFVGLLVYLSAALCRRYWLNLHQTWCWMGHMPEETIPFWSDLLKVMDSGLLFKCVYGEPFKCSLWKIIQNDNNKQKPKETLGISRKVQKINTFPLNNFLPKQFSQSAFTQQEDIGGYISSSKLSLCI